jgi:hypothetical protein
MVLAPCTVNGHNISNTGLFVEEAPLFTVMFLKSNTVGVPSIFALAIPANATVTPAVVYMSNVPYTRNEPSTRAVSVVPPIFNEWVVNEPGPALNVAFAKTDTLLITIKIADVAESNLSNPPAPSPTVNA